MMDEVIYGVTESANIDILWNDPPVNESRSELAPSPRLFAK